MNSGVSPGPAAWTLLDLCLSALRGERLSFTLPQPGSRPPLTDPRGLAHGPSFPPFTILTTTASQAFGARLDHPASLGTPLPCSATGDLVSSSKAKLGSWGGGGQNGEAAACWGLHSLTPIRLPFLLPHDPT